MTLTLASPSVRSAVTRDASGMPVIIGLMGRKRSGKDTAGAFLADEFGYRRVAFADALKDALLLMDPLVTDRLRLSEVVESMTWEGAKTKGEVRRVLQTFGDAVRWLDEDTFTRRILCDVRHALKWGERLVVTDVRRMNEIRMLAAHGALLVRVERPGLPNDDAHISETEHERYTGPFARVSNGGTIEDLHAHLRRLVTEV